MTGPLRSTITFLQDNVSLYAATTWNTPYGQVADLVDSHLLNIAQGGATLYRHDETHIAISADFPETTTRATVPTTLRAALDQIIAAWVELLGSAPGTFRTATVATTVNALAASIAAATASGTSGHLAKYDTNNGLTLGTVVVVPPTGNSVNGYSVGAPLGFTANLYYGQVNSIAVFSVNYLGDITGHSITVGGNGSIGGTLHVVGTSIFDGVITGTLTGTATGLAAPIPFDAAVSDYKLSQNVGAQSVTVATGGPYADSTGAMVPSGGTGFAQRTVNLSNNISSTQPSGTFVQWVNISAAPVTGALVATGGSNTTTLGSATVPTTPTGNTCLGWVIWRGATTNPTNIVAAIDIFNARFPSGAGVGGTGSGGGIPATAQVLLSGTNPGAPDGLDVTNPATPAAINLALLRDSLTDTSLEDLFQYGVSTNVMNSIQSGPGGTLQLTTTSGEITVKIPGRTRTITNLVQTSNAASALGTYQLVADLTANGVSTFTLSLASLSTPVTGNKIVIARCFWDGANWQLGIIDWANIAAVLPGTQYAPIVLRAQVSASSTINSNAGYVALSALPTLTAYFPCAMRATISWQALIINGAAAGGGSLFATMDGVGQGFEQNVNHLTTASGTAGGICGFADVPNIPANQSHTFGISGITAGSGQSWAVSKLLFYVSLTR